MSDQTYSALRKYLDQYPTGYPATESGVEIKILKRLFTPEEAEIVLKLSPRAEESEAIAPKLGLNLEEVEELLDRMANKGLLFRVRRNDKSWYNPAPFMIGLYEYAVKVMDKELAGLFKEYYDTAFLHELSLSKIPGFKVIPIGKHVHPDTVLFPYHQLEESIKQARKIATTDCVCRLEADLLEHTCEHPTEDTCLSFGAAAEYYIESGLGREITADEALDILKKTDESGLVHAGANSKHLSNICNCCPCCCASLKGIAQHGHEKSWHMNALFLAQVDEDECTACEICVDRCPVDAIVVDDVAVVTEEKCLGCGLCASGCAFESISMIRREGAKEPYDRLTHMGMEVMKAKQERLAKLK